jgi:hypothetical protein
MSLPKTVREAVARLRAEGFTPEVEKSRKHFRIRHAGAVILTLHQGSIDRNLRHKSCLQAVVNKLKRTSA